MGTQLQSLMLGNWDQANHSVGGFQQDQSSIWRLSEKPNVYLIRFKSEINGCELHFAITDCWRIEISVLYNNVGETTVHPTTYVGVTTVV